MPGRSNPLNMVDADGHRYGFQGQELDDEIKGGRGTSVNYKYRMHDPRVGRFFAIDPLMKDYPHNSPYAFSENNVTHAIELEGLEREVIINRQVPTTAALAAATGNTTFAPSGMQWFDLIMTQSVDAAGNQMDLVMTNNGTTPVNVSGRRIAPGARTSRPMDVLTVDKNIFDANTRYTNALFESAWQQRAINLAAGSNPLTTPTSFNVTGIAGNIDLQSRNLPGTENLQNTFVRHGHFRTFDATGTARNITTANPANQANRYIVDINALNQGGNLSNVTIDIRFQDASANTYTNAIVNAFTTAGYTVNSAFGDTSQPTTDYFQLDIYLTPASQNTATGDSNAGNSRR